MFDKIGARTFLADKNQQEGLKVSEMRTRDWLKFADELSEANLKMHHESYTRSITKLLNIILDQIFHGKK